MTIIVDSKTVISCVCPECGRENYIGSHFPHYVEFEGVYFKADLQEVDCDNCPTTFYASEYGLKNIPDEFLSEVDKEKNNFVGKFVKFYAYQDVKEGDNVVFTFSPTAKYKCNQDVVGRVVVEFPDGKNSHLCPKNLVYLSEE